MRQSGQDVWWRKSRQLAALTVVAVSACALLPWLVGGFGARTIVGLPLPFFLFVLGLPIAVLVAVFWFARRQIALDHRYDVTGNQG